MQKNRKILPIFKSETYKTNFDGTFFLVLHKIINFLYDNNNGQIDRQNAILDADFKKFTSVKIILKILNCGNNSARIRLHFFVTFLVNLLYENELDRIGR